MRRVMIMIPLVLVSLLGYSQFGKGNPEIMKSWKERTLVVITYPKSDIYNEAVRSVVEERWYNDKVEYIGYSKMKEIKKKKDIVILNVKNWMDYLNSPVICLTTKMNGHFEYNFTYNNYGSAYMNIQSAHDLNWKTWKDRFNKNKSKVVKNSGIAWGLEKIRKSSIERIKLIVEQLFNTVDKFEVEEYQYKNAKKDNLAYNDKNIKVIMKKKTLLIPEGSLPRTKKNRKLLNLDYLKSLYKGSVKIVTEEELSEAIKTGVNDAVYFHTKEEVSHPAYSMIDLDTGKIIYSGVERAKPGDSSPIKIFERMLMELSISVN